MQANRKILIPIISIIGVGAVAYIMYRKFRNNKITDVANSNNSNIDAFLKMIRWAEGTIGEDGYRTCYGYSHKIVSYLDHPSITGEWKGLVLTPTQCHNAGLGAGCRSTAAGAYQITKTTWKSLRNSGIELLDFSPKNQDKAAIALLDRCGALGYVINGKFSMALKKSSSTWASLPYNDYKQGNKSFTSLLSIYKTNGGEVV